MHYIFSSLTFSYNKMLHTAATFFLLAVVFSSCIKDHCLETREYKYYKPVYMTYEQLRSSVASLPAKGIKDAGKIYYKDHFIFLNEINKGIHVIDNSNPSSPQNIAFINIPGNVDLAVKDNILYADSYSDLVAINISDPAHCTEVNRIQDVFPDRTYNYGYVYDPHKGVVIDWQERDTIIESDCSYSGPLYLMEGDMTFTAMSSSSTSSSVATSPGTGVGGSLSRFTICNNYLYTIDNWNLHLFNIAVSANPIEGNTINVTWNIETIYAYQNNLFIGSSSGVYIYDASNPSSPVQKSIFVHVTSCDPVCVDGNFAYSTLRGGTPCNGFTNQMDVIDVSDLNNPVLKTSYSLTGPYGLSKDGNQLFICDGSAGLKVFDATDPLQMTMKQNITNIFPLDVIAVNHNLIVVARNGLYQYDYSNPFNLSEISKLDFTE